MGSSVINRPCSQSRSNAAANGLTTHGAIVAWLKRDFELGHGHATAIAGVVLKAGAPRATADQKLDALFSGKKARWREPCEGLFAKLGVFGPGVAFAAGGTYINLLRDGKRFGIVQPSSADRLDILDVSRPLARGMRWPRIGFVSVILRTSTPNCFPS
jgi:hypothetical protein